MLKTTTLYLYLEQELHSDEISIKLVFHSMIFLATEIESFGTIISKQYFVSSN